jgi:hypothetical protein
MAAQFLTMRAAYTKALADVMSIMGALADAVDPRTEESFIASANWMNWLFVCLYYKMVSSCESAKFVVGILLL